MFNNDDREQMFFASSKLVDGVVETSKLIKMRCGQCYVVLKRRLRAKAELGKRKRDEVHHENLAKLKAKEVAIKQEHFICTGCRIVGRPGLSVDNVYRRS